jgi:hypothetical protein
MNDKKQVTFNLKGTRKYVHGTDIFDYFIKDVDSFNTITLSFHEPCLNPCCTIVQLLKEEEVPNKKSAVFKVENGDQSQRFYIEVPKAIDTTNSQRIDYNEDKIIKSASIDGKQARIMPNPSYTFIENLVALTKHFHLAYFDESGGQWFFAQLEIFDDFDTSNELVLMLHKNIGRRLTQSNIFQNNKKIGSIYFSFHK